MHLTSTHETRKETTNKPPPRWRSQPKLTQQRRTNVSDLGPELPSNLSRCSAAGHRGATAAACAGGGGRRVRRAAGPLCARAARPRAPPPAGGPGLRQPPARCYCRCRPRWPRPARLPPARTASMTYRSSPPSPASPGLSRRGACCYLPRAARPAPAGPPASALGTEEEEGAETVFKKKIFKNLPTFVCGFFFFKLYFFFFLREIQFFYWAAHGE